MADQRATRNQRLYFTFFIGATFQGIEIGDGLASKSNGLFSAEDWQCGKVGVTVQKGRANSE